MRPLETRTDALRLAAAGLNDCEIARRLDVPRTTVRDWRRPSYMPKRATGSRCPLCGERSRRVAIEAESYAKYPAIVEAAEALVRALLPENQAGRLDAEQGRMAVIWIYSAHLSCLFPQHGDGKKHDRPIVLEPWQRELVEAAPWALLRGLIRSDGCVFVNRTGRYKYISYEFANRSRDILDLCEATCRQVGLRPRRYERAIRLYRRDDVALLLEHVGVKS